LWRGSVSSDTVLLALLLAVIAGVLAGRAWAKADRLDNLDPGVLRSSAHFSQGLHLLASGHSPLALGEFAKVARGSPGFVEVQEVLGRAVVLFLFNEALAQGLSLTTKRKLLVSIPAHLALLLIAEAGIELGEYSPLEIKISVVGYGRAEKHQVQMMVASLLRLEEPIASEDACDALAVAMCHVANRAMRLKLEGVRA